MTTQTKVRTIAGKLTETMRRDLVYGRFPEHNAQLREHRTRNALVGRGLCTFKHIIAGRGDFTLTDTGQAVREYLLQNWKPNR